MMMQPPVPGQSDNNNFGGLNSATPKAPKLFSGTGFNNIGGTAGGSLVPKLTPEKTDFGSTMGSIKPDLGPQASGPLKTFNANNSTQDTSDGNVTVGNILQHYHKSLWDGMTPQDQTQMHQFSMPNDVVKNLSNWPPSGSGYTIGQPVTAGHVIAYMNNPLWNCLDASTKATAHANVLDPSTVKNLTNWPPKDAINPNADIDGMKLAMGDSTQKQPGDLMKTDVGYGASTESVQHYDPNKPFKVTINNSEPKPDPGFANAVYDVQPLTNNSIKAGTGGLIDLVGQPIKQNFIYPSANFARQLVGKPSLPTNITDSQLDQLYAQKYGADVLKPNLKREVLGKIGTVLGTATLLGGMGEAIGAKPTIAAQPIIYHTNEVLSGNENKKEAVSNAVTDIARNLIPGGTTRLGTTLRQAGVGAGSGIVSSMVHDISHQKPIDFNTALRQGILQGSIQGVTGGILHGTHTGRTSGTYNHMTGTIEPSGD